MYLLSDDMVTQRPPHLNESVGLSNASFSDCLPLALLSNPSPIFHDKPALLGHLANTVF